MLARPEPPGRDATESAAVAVADVDGREGARLVDEHELFSVGGPTWLVAAGDAVGMPEVGVGDPDGIATCLGAPVALEGDLPPVG